MRTLLACAAAATLLLAGCGSSAEPDDEETGSATEPPSPTEAVDPVELAGAICEALDGVREMPSAEIVEYEAVFNDPTGWSTNAPVCDIEPVGEYYDVAAEAGEFGRAEFSYAPSEEGGQYPEYDPAAPEELLTLDQGEPLRDEVPCAEQPCEDGINGYQYNYRFETVVGDFVMIAQLDYITTDTAGDQQDEYRERAVSAFTGYMEALADQVE